MRCLGRSYSCHFFVACALNVQLECWMRHRYEDAYPPPCTLAPLRLIVRLSTVSTSGRLVRVLVRVIGAPSGDTGVVPAPPVILAGLTALGAIKAGSSAGVS